MQRRRFLTLTGTLTGGMLVLPDFLHALSPQNALSAAGNCVVFIQLNGGNDGLNTFIPIDDPAYFAARPKIAVSRSDAIALSGGMAFHPALKNFADMQQAGHLSVIQNVGYLNPVRSHFRSQEIWQTASAPDVYLTDGWLGRYLDFQCNGHQPTAGINIDSIDNLALKGNEPNSITVKDPARFTPRGAVTSLKLSDNPQLDFVRKIAGSVSEGAEGISEALKKSTGEAAYPKTGLGKNLEWIARLIKGGLNSKVYYTSLGGFDTHDNQVNIQKNKLGELNDAAFSFYSDMKGSGLLGCVTLVVFSEFGRRVHDNGNGTDHGTAAPMFVVSGGNKAKVIGKNPDLIHLDKGDLIHETDFRSVYAALLKDKLAFDPARIGIANKPLTGLF